MSAINVSAKRMATLEDQPEDPQGEVCLATRARVSLIVLISIIQGISITVLATGLRLSTGDNFCTWSVIIFNLLTLLVVGAMFHHRVVRLERRWIQPRNFAAFTGFAVFTIVTVVLLAVRLASNGLAADLVGLPDPTAAAYSIFALSNIAMMCSLAGLFVTYYGCRSDTPPKVPPKPLMISKPRPIQDDCKSELASIHKFRHPLREMQECKLASAGPGPKLAGTRPSPLKLLACVPDPMLKLRYVIEPSSPAASGDSQRTYVAGAAPACKPSLRSTWSEVTLR